MVRYGIQACQPPLDRRIDKNDDDHEASINRISRLVMEQVKQSLQEEIATACAAYNSSLHTTAHQPVDEAKLRQEVMSACQESMGVVEKRMRQEIAVRLCDYEVKLGQAMEHACGALRKEVDQARDHQHASLLELRQELAGLHARLNKRSGGSTGSSSKEDFGRQCDEIAVQYAPWLVVALLFIMIAYLTDVAMRELYVGMYQC